MKNVSKFFSSFVLILALSQTAFGQGDNLVYNSLDAWVYNKFEKLDSGIVSFVHAIYPGKVNNQGIDRVGIGTKRPGAVLHVMGEESAGSNATLKISSGNKTMHLDGNEIDTAVGTLYLNKNYDGNVTLVTGGGNVGIGTSNPGHKLDINGTTRTKVIEITGGSDLSEEFDISKPHNIKNYIKQKEDFKIEPGMVTCIDPENPGKLLVSSKAYDRTVAGIISGAGGVQPGMLMGQKGSEADGEYPVALTGRVYCKADATLGRIQPGDLLTTSDTPGYVMKVSDYERSHGATIGKAMSSLDKGKGLVLILVSLQ